MSESKPTIRPHIGKNILASRQRDDDGGAQPEPLLLGIDLGTSRSSVVSLDGKRKTIESYVGYPKDAVSKKLLKADVIFGRHALDNRLAVELYRPLEKGVIKGTFDGPDSTNDTEGKNIEAAKDLVGHLVELMEPGRDELIYAVIGVPSLASSKNKEAMIAAAKASCDAVMLVSEPFTVAYGMERMSDILVIDIGAGTTDMCRMHGTVPGEEDEVTIPVAGDAIDLKLMELIKQAFPKASITQNMCKTFKEQYGYVSDTKDKIEVLLPVDGKPTPHDITVILREACSIIIDPIVHGIHKLVSTFNPEYQERLRQNILLSGGGGLMRGLNKRIEEEMLKDVGGGKVTIVEEPLYAGAVGALQLAQDMPADYWQQLR
jgi:rod shape-determining protein MreB